MSSVSSMLMHSDPLRYAGAAVYPYSPNLERKFKAESRFDEEYNLSRHVGDELYVPRALCPVGPNDQRDKGEAVNFPSQPVPRPGQAKVFLEVKKALLAGMSGVVCAYTGWGKTVLGYFAAAILGVKTLVITTKDDIYQQWIDGACGVVSRGNPDGTNFLGLKRSDVGEIRGDKCEVVGKKFVVAMIHSLSKPGRYPAWITKGFGLVIFDECVTPDTLIDGVTAGQRKVGDRIRSFGPDGVVKREITRIRRKQSDTFVRLTAGGVSYVGTDYHPVFVQGVGFIPQALVREGDVVCKLRGTGSRDQRTEDEACYGTAGGVLSGVSIGSVLETHDRGQSDLQAGSSGEDVQVLGRETFTVQAWRERSGFDRAAAEIATCFIEFEPGSGVSGGVRRRGVEEGLAEILRRGHCSTRQEAGDRARRSFAQYFEGQGFRCPQGRGVDLVRVDRIEVQERAGAYRSGWCDADGTVIDIEVEDTHTFFANGILTHNCHRLPADQFQAVADMFDAYWRMGLSATVERADGKEILIYSHVGPVIARTEVEELVPRIIRYKSPWECPRTLRSDPVTGEKSVIRVPHEPGKTAHIERSIAAHDERNAMLCDILQTTLAKGRQTVFFSTQIEHLRTVQRRLNQHHGVSGKNIGIYIHASTKAEKAARDKQAGRPILLTTYGMMSEGTNFPWLDTCLLGMPRAKVNQPVGRIRREYEDKSQPVVLDIVDDDSPVFAGYAISRLKWYQSLGCEITNMW